jgi:hypothetical protein
MSVSRRRSVMSCRGLCDGPIPRTEENYRLFMCPGATVILYTYHEYAEEIRLRNNERYSVGIFTYYSYMNIVY